MSDAKDPRFDVLVRFMGLLREHGEAEWFDLDGHPCRYEDWVGCENWARLKLVNRHGHRFEVEPAELAGHYFNEWQL